MAHETSKASTAANGDALGNVAHDQAINIRDITPAPPQFNNALIPSPNLRRRAEKVHDLGPLPLAYLFAEILAGVNVDEAIDRYAALPGDFIAACGADRDRPRLFAIDGGRTS
jgi:hypothetical protein